MTKVSRSVIKVRSNYEDRVSITTMIDQSEYILIGGVYSDAEGKINQVGLIHKNGTIVVDWPEKTLISDALQVGIKP